MIDLFVFWYLTAFIIAGWYLVVEVTGLWREHRARRWRKPHTPPVDVE